MAKLLPRALNGTIAHFDTILNQQSSALAGVTEPKFSLADLCRLYTLRLELEDRFKATNPKPVFARWLNPAWMHRRSEIPGALELLEYTRAEYLAALNNPDHDDTYDEHDYRPYEPEAA
jgi:hypothetical protein